MNDFELSQAGSRESIGMGVYLAPRWPILSSRGSFKSALLFSRLPQYPGPLLPADCLGGVPGQHARPSQQGGEGADADMVEVWDVMKMVEMVSRETNVALKGFHESDQGVEEPCHQVDQEWLRLPQRGQE